MKKIIFSFLAMVLIAPAFAQEESEISLDLGMKAPMTEIKLADVDGKLKTLKSLKGENGIIVVFSCNTCPFVVGSRGFEGWEKQYNGLATYASDHGISFVLVNSNEAKRDDEDSSEEMVKRAKEKGYNMPYLLDENSTMADAFGAKTTPHVYMMDASMKLVYKGSIDNTWDSKAKIVVPYLEQAIREYHRGEEISFPDTAPKGCSIKRN